VKRPYGRFKGQWPSFTFLDTPRGNAFSGDLQKKAEVQQPQQRQSSGWFSQRTFFPRACRPSRKPRISSGAIRIESRISFHSQTENPSAKLLVFVGFLQARTCPYQVFVSPSRFPHLYPPSTSPHPLVPIFLGPPLILRILRALRVFETTTNRKGAFMVLLQSEL
jgi:hypothetical protein